MALEAEISFISENGEEILAQVSKLVERIHSVSPGEGFNLFVIGFSAGLMGIAFFAEKGSEKNKTS